jgi:hypothetical protein
VLVVGGSNPSSPTRSNRMSDPFVIAGEAACLLEERGDYTAVARKDHGAVTLQCFRRDRPAVGVCIVIEGDVDSVEDLVRSAIRGLDGLEDDDEGESDEEPESGREPPS